MRKTIFSMLLALFPVYAIAGGSTGYINLNNPIQVVEEGAESRVFLYNVVVNDGGCSNTVPVILLNPNRIASKEFYSTILMAKAAGKKVNLTTNGCWLNNQYPIVSSIYVE
jgi:hypothetical protein